MRIRLLDRFRDGEATVGELSEALSASQQNVSKHLGALADMKPTFLLGLFLSQ